MLGLKANKRPWWKLHASSYLVALFVLTVCSAMNLGAYDVDDKPGFGWPFIYLSVDFSLPGDPFGGTSAGLLWLWQYQPASSQTWHLVSLGMDVSVLIFTFALIVALWEWRRRNRRSLWRFTLFDLMVSTAVVAVIIAEIQSLYRDARTHDALMSLGQKTAWPEGTAEWERSCVRNMKRDQRVFWLFEALHVQNEHRPIIVTGLTFRDNRMTDEAVLAAARLLADLRDLDEFDVELRQPRNIDWAKCRVFDRMQSLQIAHSVSDGELQRFPAWRNLETLRLDAFHASDKGVSELAKFPKLRVVTLTSVRTDSIQGLASLQSSRSLRYLRVSGSRPSNEDLSTVGRLQSLEELTLNGPGKLGIRPSGISGLFTTDTRPHSPTPLPLDTLGNLPNLRHLKLSCYNLDATSASALAKLSCLETFELMECDVRAADLAPLKQCARLRSLTLECHDLHGDSLQVLTDLKELQHLYLLDASFDDDDLKKVCQMTNLETLELSAENITDVACSI